MWSFFLYLIFMIMKYLIKKILNEIVFNPDREKFKWRDISTLNVDGKKIHTSTFRTPTYKYIVNAEEYPNHFYLISFHPSLNTDFFAKQFLKQERGRTYYDKYSYRTNEKVISPEDQVRLSKMGSKERREELNKLPSMAYKVFALIMEYMDEILKKDPLASFGYFGAADSKGSENPAEELLDTKRFRVYRLMLDNHFKDTHMAYHKELFSGSLYINKESEKDFPNIIEFGNKILQSHL